MDIQLNTNTITDIRSELVVKKHFLFGGYSAKYKLIGTLPNNHISLITNEIINNFLPTECFFNSQLTDLKGTYTKKDPLSEPEDEILYIQGKLPEQILSDTLPDREQYVDFFIRITSRFIEFTKGNHIINQPIVKQSLNIPQFLNLRNIATVFPVKIEKLRLGLDIFQTHYIVSSLGASSVVSQSLKLICDGNALELSISAEKLKSRNSEPLERGHLFSKLSNIFDGLYNLSISRDWDNKLV